jgi:hypothetical protein
MAFPLNKQESTYIINKRFGQLMLSVARLMHLMTG